jgi:hypothetical protein
MFGHVWVSQALFKYNRKNFMFDKHLKQALRLWNPYEP